MIRITLSIAAAAAAAILCLAIPHAQAGLYGNAPWCAVQNVGTGNMEWDCEYRTAEQCAPAVVAGNRGFCNLNPYWADSFGRGEFAGAPYPRRHWRHRRHAY